MAAAILFPFYPTDIFILPIIPRTEYRSTNAYDGRAMANGNLPVVGHSDGKLTEILQVREEAVQTLLEFPDTHEICSSTVLVAIPIRPQNLM